MGAIREFLDKIFLSDFEWKKKYCPTLASWVFGSEEDRHKMFLQIVENTKNQKICPDCYGIYWDEDCPECNGRGVCGAYVLYSQKISEE